MLQDDKRGQRGQRHLDFRIHPTVFVLVAGHRLATDGKRHAGGLELADKLQVGIIDSEFLLVVDVVQHGRHRLAVYDHHELEVLGRHARGGEEIHCPGDVSERAIDFLRIGITLGDAEDRLVGHIVLGQERGIRQRMHGPFALDDRVLPETGLGRGGGPEQQKQDGEEG